MRPARHGTYIADTLRALGGEATLGDLLAVTAMARSELESALEELLADDAAHVRVCASGDVVYHVRDLRRVHRPRGGADRESWGAPGEGCVSRPSPRSPASLFDRKTLQLIRAREGVLGIAELVEHTGLRVVAAEREMSRLAGRYGGEPHVSLDHHVVHAFPELMTSAHGRFSGREPRPAWVRARAPLGGRTWADRLLGSTQRERLRRHVLGLVIQTALAGKGVVSLNRAVEYLGARTRRSVSRRAVGIALRELADDFDAPRTELGGDVFFGFRNVKRQFLASEMVRRRIRLARTASGETVFDTADSAARAAERELEAFDVELKKINDSAGAGE